MFSTGRIVLLLVALILFLPSLSMAGIIDLPRTGQTTCYDSTGNVIACTGTGQDGEVQAGVPWPSSRFTNNGDGTVTDNLTGLMWTKDGNAPGPAACSPATAKTWQGALDYVVCLNTNSYLGYTDWRLSNVNELESLINIEQSYSSIWLNIQGFSNVQGSYYWSSTTVAFIPFNAWVVGMGTGYVYYDFAKSNNFYVWPVRSGHNSPPANVWESGQTMCYDATGAVISCAGTGQDGDILAGVAWPSPRFTDNGNGTVTDNLTGLMWTKDSNAPGPAECFPATTKSWQEALNYVTCLNTFAYLGYTDWRLPNRKERHNMIDFSKYNPSLPSVHPFLNVSWYFYWTSTSFTSFPDYAWIIDMLSGRVNIHEKSFSLYVWPVRSVWVVSLRNLIISKAGTGSGNVTSTPAGVNCGSDCTELYDYGTVTTLTATSDTTSVFTGWSGDPDCSDGTITMDADKSCTATFVKIWFEEVDPVLSYTGTWNNYSCPSCSGGSLRFSGQTGAKADFSFNGTGIKWIVTKANLLGKARVYLDGVNMGLVDLYSPAPKYKVALQKTGLTSGIHTITLEVSGLKNTASAGNLIDIDAFEVVP